MKQVKFHWALPIEAVKSSESQKDTSGQVDIHRLCKFVETADRTRISHLLTPFGFHMPDPVPLLGMLSSCSSRVGFLLAYRTGSISPVLFTQQCNTLSQILGPRLALNFVAGISPAEQAQYGDFLAHDDRYARAEEFIRICKNLWNSNEGFDFQGRHYQLKNAKLQTNWVRPGERPRIYISGNSEQAQNLARNVADCWLRYGDTPDKLESEMPMDIRSGKNIQSGLRISVIARKTTEEAHLAAEGVIKGADPNWKAFVQKFVQECDSKAVQNTYRLSQLASDKWLNETLWTGAIPYRGGPALAIVGNYSQVAHTLRSFCDIGLREFILSGWPTQEEIIRFDQEVLPIFYEGEEHVQTA